MRARRPTRLPRAVVFDMDGLMLDTERVASRCWSAAASTIGVAFDTALLRSMIGRNARDSREFVLAHYGADFPVDALMRESRTMPLVLPSLADVKAHLAALPR